MNSAINIVIDDREARCGILQGIPGVGPERACTLLDAFGSVEAVLTASAEELGGVGTHTITAIHWAVHEHYTEYNGSSDNPDPIL